MVEDVSELFDSVDEHQTPLHIKKIVCGRRFCMAAFDYGAFFVWGDNEVGQLGNRKRSFIESPYPKPKFELHHNVENIVCGVDSAAVIVESLPPRKKKKQKSKRSMSVNDVNRITEQSIKKQNEEAMFNNQRKEKAEEED
jgi:alpha-tubulin suppressor-like RCC1 family protein